MDSICAVFEHIGLSLVGNRAASFTRFDYNKNASGELNTQRMLSWSGSALSCLTRRRKNSFGRRRLTPSAVLLRSAYEKGDVAHTQNSSLHLAVCFSRSMCGSLFSAPVLSQLCEEALSILMESELVSADAPRPPSGPGAAQYLLSLTRLAVSAVLERPELWGLGERGPQLLGRLLQCPHHEVRLLVLEEVLKELEGEAEGSSQRRPVSTFLQQSACTLTTMALQEKHPQCLEKVTPPHYHSSGTLLPTCYLLHSGTVITLHRVLVHI